MNKQELNKELLDTLYWPGVNGARQTKQSLLDSHLESESYKDEWAKQDKLIEFYQDIILSMVEGQDINELDLIVWEAESYNSFEPKYIIGTSKETVANYLDGVEYITQPAWDKVVFKGQLSQVEKFVGDEGIFIWGEWVEDGEDEYVFGWYR